MWEEGKSPFTLVLGLIVVAFGIIPLLNNLGVIGFNLPFTPTGIALEVIMLVGGAWLLIAGFMEIAGISDTIGWISV